MAKSATQRFAQLTYEKPRESLTTIPDEIIEQIAENLRDDFIGNESYADCFLSDGCTDFSTTRFDLSSFSKVCTAVRWPAERALYRDIHVHFEGMTGMNSPAHPEWRGGSLHLLLRTLEGRIDLRRCVRSVQMDWHEEMYDSEDEDPTHHYDALRRFFSHCPSVRRLNILSFSTQLFSEIAPLSQVTAFATSVPRLHVFRTIMKTFPVLQDLHLVIDCRFGPPPTYVKFLHQLKKLHLESICVASMFWALEVCAQITEELHVISESDCFPEVKPPPVLPSPSAGTNLRSLWVVGNRLNFLANPNSGLAQAIRQLPSLQHLHMSRCFSFHAAAFSVLPASLRCLYLSDYGEWRNNNRSRHLFVVALGRCLTQTLRKIEMVAIHGWTGKAIEDQKMGNLAPLQSVCDERNIPFHLNIGSNNDWMSGEIRILFA